MRLTGSVRPDDFLIRCGSSLKWRSSVDKLQAQLSDIFSYCRTISCYYRCEWNKNCRLDACVSNTAESLGYNALVGKTGLAGEESNCETPAARRIYQFESLLFLPCLLGPAGNSQSSIWQIPRTEDNVLS
jgi:hypothetical protein